MPSEHFDSATCTVYIYIYIYSPPHSTCLSYHTWSLSSHGTHRHLGCHRSLPKRAVLISRLYSIHRQLLGFLWSPHNVDCERHFWNVVHPNVVHPKLVASVNCPDTSIKIASLLSFLRSFAIGDDDRCFGAIVILSGHQLLSCCHCRLPRLT